MALKCFDFECKKCKAIWEDLVKENEQSQCCACKVDGVKLFSYNPTLRRDTLRNPDCTFPECSLDYKVHD